MARGKNKFRGCQMHYHSEFTARTIRSTVRDTGKPSGALGLSAGRPIPVRSDYAGRVSGTMLSAVLFSM